MFLDDRRAERVEPEALEFCFDAVAAGTAAEGARLEIERVAGRRLVPRLRRTVPLAERFGACPRMRALSRADDGRRRIEDPRNGDRLMCRVCGCGEATIALDKDKAGDAHAPCARPCHDHDHRPRSSSRSRSRPRVISHGEDGAVDYGRGIARRACARHEPGAHRPHRARHSLQERRLRARQPRASSPRSGVFALNFVSSPGSGKTTLLVRTIEDAEGRACRSR